MIEIPLDRSKNYTAAAKSFMERSGALPPATIMYQSITQGDLARQLLIFESTLSYLNLSKGNRLDFDVLVAEAVCLEAAAT